MARLLTVLLATALAGASFTGARAQTWTWPWDFHPQQLSGADGYDDGRAWRHYPPHYGAERFPEEIVVLAEGVAENPCFLGGCHYYHGDLGYAAHWGHIRVDGRSTEEAFRALSAHADKAAVSSVMVEPSAGRAHHGAHKRRHAAAEQ